MLDVPPALNLIVSVGDAGDGFAIGDVFFDEDSLGERVGVVALENWDRSLQDDGAVVEMFVDKVDRAAGNLDAVVKCLLLGVEAGECGKQRRMDVENAVGERGNKAGREQAHVAGETDEVDLVFAKAADEVAIVLGAGPAFGDV